ncbi:helix-turn-helix transcriptional regulator [Geodermatophilus sp. URMC 62]|uniref:helix-turn-helix transcriptional regulator n=1 Tax=Geodermatophilus sp. URMC 62 TaxID=3423414 RepID=UPI00406CEC98
MGDRLLTPPEVADYLGVPLRTLYNWRTTHDGPRAVRVGKHLRYSPAEVAAWVTAQTETAPRSGVTATRSR